MFISDTPINVEEDDVLGRARFSHALAETIIDFDDTKSIVIGLYGKWGVGKSSVVNLMLDYLEKKKEYIDKQVLTISFNPWNFSEQNQLITTFFNELANKLQYIDKSKQAKSIAKKLKLYGSFLSATAVISDLLRYIFPTVFFVLALLIFGSSYFQNIRIIAYIISSLLAVFGLISAVSKKVLFSISDFFLEKSKFSEKTLEDLKNDLNDAILKQNKRLIIVIDDIDRLNQKEIKQMLQLVKINADFPNTVYLLPFERKIIEKNLEEQKGLSGKEYLEKIVQVDFDIPAIQKAKLYKHLFAQLDAIIKHVPENRWDERHWGNLFHSGFKEFFHSLRDVKRYINSLHFNFLLIKKEDVFELNPIDFIGIEAIRIFVPDFYHSLKEKNSLFTSINSHYGSRSSSKEDDSRKNEIDDLLNSTPDYVRSIVYELFPQVKGLFDNTHYGNDFQERWKKELRICATELFDRYFILDVPEGEIAQFEAETLLTLTNSREKFVEELRKYIKDGRIRKALDMLGSFTDSFDLADAEVIVTSLFDISDELPEERGGFFDIGIGMCLMRIIYHYLKRFKNVSKTSEILKKAIKQTTGLYGCVDKISIEIQGIEKESQYERLISKEDAGKFKELCSNKIKEFQTSPVLRRSKHLAYMLYRWRDWRKVEEPREFAGTFLDSDEGIVFLVKSFLSRSHRHSMGDYISRVVYKIDYKGLSEFIDLERVKEHIKKIDISKLSGNSKRAVELFLKNFDRKDKNNDFDED